jgi:hypothetical protein
VNVRSVGVGRVGVCMLCVCDSEERERGVGVGVNATMMSTTLDRRGRRSCHKNRIHTGSWAFFATETPWRQIL